MKSWEKIEAVQRIQDYIKEHINEEDFHIRDLYPSLGYSQRHAIRMFKELLGKTPLEYIRAIRLSESSAEILQKDKTILSIALEAQYESHEGYTRAFTDEFGVTPKDYRQGRSPIPLFVQYPVKHAYAYLNNQEVSKMDKEKELCMITVVSRPKRKLMVQYSEKAKDYWSFCEEKGCEWEGLFNSIPGKMDIAALVELPNHLVKANKTNCAAAVELPLDYEGAVPEDYDIVILEPCDMMYFQTEPFDNEDDFGLAIDSVLRVIEKYDPQQYGYKFAPELAPRYNYGANAVMGAKQAIPVKRI